MSISWRISATATTAISILYTPMPLAISKAAVFPKVPSISIPMYGLATSILATARNLGMAFGVGGAALLCFEFGGRTSALAALQAVRPAFAVIACSAILYAILATQWDPRRNERQARLAQSVKL